VGRDARGPAVHICISFSCFPYDLEAITDEPRRYKYFLFLVQDCNFQLINQNVASTAKDLIVGDGFSYFINHEKYTKFLQTHVLEDSDVRAK
jgi:hypothetical protein